MVRLGSTSTGTVRRIGGAEKVRSSKYFQKQGHHSGVVTRNELARLTPRHRIVRVSYATTEINGGFNAIEYFSAIWGSLNRQYTT